VQLTGENYFIPVDAKIARDTDVPVEGIRLSDYMRQLSALPLKANVIVLDAARANPFAKEGQPLAGGLALVEPDPKMLIAFNAAPGTVAADGTPPYGPYAQALAEMIRAGGLSLPEVFDRVRLRVNDMTKGAQLPWDAQKVDAPFVFFERKPDAPPVQADAGLRTKPIRDFVPKEAYAAALERDTLQGYEEFVTAFPRDPLCGRVRAIVAARRESIVWRRTYRTDTPPAYWSYLDRYPRGPHVADARRRLVILSAALEPPRSYAAIAYDVPPPPPDEIVYVERPVLYFDDPVFAFAPPPAPPVYFLPPPPPDFVILAPPPPPVGLFILPQPFFVPIPVYVQAPVYVAPPPNNIIFANIHNTTVINNVINQPPPQTPAGSNTAAPGTPNTPLNAKGGAGQGAITQVSTGAQVQTPTPAKTKAAAIMKGDEPPPKSLVINGTAKSITSGTQSGQKGGATSTSLTPSGVPTGHDLPKTNPNELSKTNPNAKLTPDNKSLTTSPNNPSGGPANPNQKLIPENKSLTNNPATGTGNPAAGGNAKTNTSTTAPLVEKPKAGETKTAIPETKPIAPEKETKIVPEKKMAVPETKPKFESAPSKPAVAPPKPPPPVAHVEPTRRASPPPPPPPHPAPQIARPAPPPPPRPAPPPPPRPAPQIARPAPPPPPPRPPPPPPPKPAPAAAKKCPPNNPKC